MSTKQMPSGTSSNKRVTSRESRFPVTEEDVFVNIVDEEEDDIHQQAGTSAAISSPRTRRSYLAMEMRAGASPLNNQKLTVKQAVPGPSVMEHHQMLLPNEFEGGLIDPADGMGIEMEGYGEDEEFFVDEDESAFIPAGNMAEFEMIEDSFHVYDQLPSNLIICDLCESRPVFANRDQFNTHRYQRHGSIVSVCACPDFECDQVFASIGTIKRHLAVDHSLPLETHFKKFDGINEFSDWIVFVQYATDTRFVMHNRQQPKRRQLLFCVFSDHRKSNNRRTGMLKPKGCCPAHVNYTINQDGTVEVIYQMYHHGHDPKSVDVEAIKPWSLAKANRENRCKVLFPCKPLIIGCRPMQYVQVDVIEMPETKYRHGTKYSNVLVVTDMFSKFMFGRSIIDGDENDQEHVVCRLLIEIFSAFGLPEGYSTVFGKDTIDRCICQVSENFRTDIHGVTSSTPCYAALRRNIELKAESDLKDKLRWPESLPATILTHNQTPHAVFQFRVSPFEVMFGRRAWYKTNPDCELPWMLPEHFSAQMNDGNTQMASTRQHDTSLPIYDSTGKALQDPLKSRILKTISLVEARCDRWEEQALTSVTSSGTLSSAELFKKLGVRQAFLPGDYVYVRGLNIPCEKGGFLRGLVSEVCWEPSTQFPYRVHVETVNGTKRELNAHNEEQFGVDGIWPTEESPSFWVSAYDVCSSSMELGIKRQPQYGSKFNSFYCSCSDNCSLFASENCSNGMSKACCDSLTKKCGYHDFYDPKNMPVDKFVESYGQNPEKMVKKVANRRTNIRRIEDGNGETASEESNKQEQNGTGTNNQQSSSTTDFLLNLPCSSPLSGNNATGAQQERPEACSSSNKANEDECEKERERFMMLEKDLHEADQKLALMKPNKNQRPGEEYLLLESDTSMLREEWTRLKKYLEVRDQQRKFKRILESNPNPSSSTSTVKRRGLRSQYIGDPTELTRQTRLIMEDNQIFPIVSMVNPQTGDGGIHNDSQRVNSSEVLQQQPQRNFEVAEMNEKRQISERRIATSPLSRPIQRTPGRGILSRKGPAKGVAKSIRNSIEVSPYTYTTAVGSRMVKTTSSAAAGVMTASKTGTNRRNAGPTAIDSAPAKEIKASSPQKVARTETKVTIGVEQTDSRKKHDLIKPARRSTRASKRPRTDEEEEES